MTLPTTVSKADSSYWLTSRYTVCFNEAVNYSVRFVVDSGGGQSWNYLVYSYREDNQPYGTHGVRPVVYLKSNIKLSYDETNGYTISEF